VAQNINKELLLLRLTKKVRCTVRVYVLEGFDF
jgi:hypothetical protein